MEDIIKRYIKSFNVVAVLKKQKIEDIVSVILYDFLACDGCYYSLLVGYNDTEVFVRNSTQSLIGKVDTKSDVDLLLLNNTRRFSTKDEWGDGKYTVDDMKSFILYCRQEASSFGKSLIGTSFNGFEVTNVKVWMYPMYSLCIYYKLNEKDQMPINILLHNKITFMENPYVGESAADFTGFLEELGLGTLVQIVKRDTALKKIEVFEEI